MFDNYVDFLQKNMDVSVLKRNVTSNNIANYSTPNYKATKVNDELLFNEEFSSLLKKTNEKHIISSFGEGEVQLVKQINAKERTDGNNVDLTLEMIDMMKANSQYGKSIQAINKEFHLHRAALGK